MSQMSIHEADAVDAEVADWLHSIIDIPASSLSRKLTEDSTHSIHFGISHTLAETTRKEDYNKFHEPRVVSIGPINHGKPHVKPMENFKQKAVRELAERAKVDHVSIEQVYASVEEHLLGTRNYYSTLFESISDRKWCQMMFLDGCFIIEFISNDNIDTSGRRSWLNMKKHDRDLVRRDLLLLDNQLPFHVLDVLARAFRSEEFTLEFLTMWFLQMPLLNISSAPNPTFLLYFKGVSYHRHQQWEAQAPVHLLQYYRYIWINVLFGDRVEEEDDDDDNKKEDYFTGGPPFSVTELKKAGIPCSCASDPFIEIHFKSSILSGKLFLPKLTLDEWGVTLLVNLVAYEFSCNLLYRSSGISSYLSFMSMLINGEEDVKELRAKGILQVIFNAGDDELVKFLRNITALPESNPQALRHVKRQISTYFKSKRLPLIVAFSEVKQRYFSGPWSFLVFLAVIFTVSMTVIQTVLTGIQTYK
ncbi:putative protein-like [Capsicum annuum]|nr:putative protein-like [Capsicum annuum]